MTLIVNPHFRTGLVDDTYRYRIDWDEFSTALLSAQNWDVLESGAIRRRPGFFRVPGTNNADWTATGVWNTSYNIRLMPYVDASGTNYLVLVELEPNTYNANITIRIFNLSTYTFETVNPSASIDTDIGSNEPSSLQYTQVGETLFFVLTNESSEEDFVYMIYRKKQLLPPTWTFYFEKLPVYGELTGLWSAPGGANYLKPTFLGQYKADGTPIAESAAAANYVVPQEEIASGDQLYLDGEWVNVYDVEESPEIKILLPQQGFGLNKHLANAKLNYRYSQSESTYSLNILAKAITFFEGRLCLGGIFHIRARVPTDYQIDKGSTRLRCSRSNDPFVLIPSKYNLYEDSPIDAVLSAPNLRTITWLAGGRVLYIGGSEGVVVVKSGLTPKSIQTVTIDVFGTCTIPPIVEQSGVIYVDRTRNAIVRLLYYEANDGYRGIVLNRLCSEKLKKFKRIAVLGGRPGTPRRLYALMDDGRIATCNLDDEGNAFGWSVYQIGPSDGTFFVDDICEVGDTLYATVLSNGLGLGTRKLIVRLGSTDSAYVGDFEQDALKSNTTGDWYVETAELRNCTVGVLGKVAGAASYTHLGVFQTTSAGVIQNEQGVSLADLFALSAVKVYRIFESIARPTPAMPRYPDGPGFGRSHRVSKVHIGVVNTRQVVVDGQIVQNPVALDVQHGTERPPVTGWISVDKTGYDVDHDLRIEGSGLYTATVVGLSREVS